MTPCHICGLWHAVEENEHKAVAYDVYEEIFGRVLKLMLYVIQHSWFTMVAIF